MQLHFYFNTRDGIWLLFPHGIISKPKFLTKLTATRMTIFSCRQPSSILPQGAVWTADSSVSSLLVRIDNTLDVVAYAYNLSIWEVETEGWHDCNGCSNSEVNKG